MHAYKVWHGAGRCCVRATLPMCTRALVLPLTMQVCARNESRHGYLRDLAERYCKSMKRGHRHVVANNDIKGTV